MEASGIWPIDNRPQDAILPHNKSDHPAIVEYEDASSSNGCGGSAGGCSLGVAVVPLCSGGSTAEVAVALAVAVVAQMAVAVVPL